MTSSENRINKRIPAKYEIKYVHDGDYLISYSKDLSVDGMFICTQKPIPVGKTIKLTFSVGEIGRAEVDSKVIWINPSELETEAGMGVKFIKTPAFLKKAILDTIRKIAVL